MVSPIRILLHGFLCRGVSPLFRDLKDPTEDCEGWRLVALAPCTPAIHLCTASGRMSHRRVSPKVGRMYLEILLPVGVLAWWGQGGDESLVVSIQQIPKLHLRLDHRRRTVQRVAVFVPGFSASLFFSLTNPR